MKAFILLGFHFQPCCENLAHFSISQEWIFPCVWALSGWHPFPPFLPRTLPFTNRRMGSKGAFTAERHFLSVCLGVFPSEFIGPLLHKRLPNLPCVACGPGRRWGRGGVGGCFKPTLSLSLKVPVNLLSTHWFEYQFQL